MPDSPSRPRVPPVPAPALVTVLVTMLVTMLGVVVGLTLPAIPAAASPSSGSRAGSPATDAPAAPQVRVTEVEPPERVVDPGYDGPATSARGLRAGRTAVATYPLEQTFGLHSAPGSRRTLHLDLDGSAGLGGAWGVDGAQPGWSLDADPAFSEAALAAIQDVWLMVAEDYAPFDVDVTTEDPGPAAITRTNAADQVFGTRVLVTGSRAQRSSADTVVCGGGCGGVAYLGVFATATEHARYQPALVFPEHLGDDTKAMADAASHEAGHTLGLSHDGTVAHGGVAAQTYHPGFDVWGPLMGAPYAAPLTQWSRGRYPWANQQEDDVSVIGAGGAPLRADLVGGTVGTAGPLPASSGTPAATGVVESAADVDVFALGTCAGEVTVRADPAAVVGPDLDLSLTLLDRDGRVLATADPVATRTSRALAAGLGASLSIEAGPGAPLYAAVDGVGAPGYPDDGSLGRYVVAATGCLPVGGAPGAPRSLTATPTPYGLGGTVTVAWAAPATGPVAGYTVAVSPGGLVRDEPAGSTGTVLTGLRPGTSYTVSVLARDGAGTTSAPALATVLVPAVTPEAVASLEASATADGGAVMTWTPPAQDGGAGVSGYLVQLGPITQVVDASVRGVTVSGLSTGATYAVAVSAQGPAGTGPARSRSLTVPLPPAGPAGSGPAGSSTSAAPGVLRPVVAPSARGAPRVGARLRVGAGTWPVSVTMRYRWSLDGRAVPGGRSWVRPPAAWAGRRVSVRLTVTAPGFEPARRKVSWSRLRR